MILKSLAWAHFKYTGCVALSLKTVKLTVFQKVFENDEAANACFSLVGLHITFQSTPRNEGGSQIQRPGWPINVSPFLISVISMNTESEDPQCNMERRIVLKINNR